MYLFISESVIGSFLYFFPTPFVVSISSEFFMIILVFACYGRMFGDL